MEKILSFLFHRAKPANQIEAMRKSDCKAYIFGSQQKKVGSQQVYLV